MRLTLEVVFHAWTEDEMRKHRFTVLPQRNGIITAREKTFTVPVTDGAGVSGTGELVDLFGCFHDDFIGQQFVEANRDPIAVPDRLRREPDGYPIGYGA